MAGYYVQLGQDMKQLLHQLSKDPTDLKLHQQLRKTAWRYKSWGGSGLGIFRFLSRPKNPLQRFIHALRVWSYEPDNSDAAFRVLLAMEQYAQAAPQTNVEPLRQWLSPIVTRMLRDQLIS